jgi:hypothetical protein
MGEADDGGDSLGSSSLLSFIVSSPSSNGVDGLIATSSTGATEKGTSADGNGGLEQESEFGSGNLCRWHRMFGEGGKGIRERFSDLTEKRGTGKTSGFR